MLKIKRPGIIRYAGIGTGTLLVGFGATYAVLAAVDFGQNQEQQVLASHDERQQRDAEPAKGKQDSATVRSSSRTSTWRDPGMNPVAVPMDSSTSTSAATPVSSADGSSSATPQTESSSVTSVDSPSRVDSTEASSQPPASNPDQDTTAPEEPTQDSSPAGSLDAGVCIGSLCTDVSLGR